MTTARHAKHITSRVSHSDCCECRADNERQFVPVERWGYDHMREYIAYARPLLALIHAGNDSSEARIWLRKFRDALHRRISLKANDGRAWRKRSDSYLERLRINGSWIHRLGEDRARAFAQRGASCLDR